MVTPVRLELTTSSLEGWRSIRLSYGVDPVFGSYQKGDLLGFKKARDCGGCYSFLIFEVDYCPLRKTGSKRGGQVPHRAGGPGYEVELGVPRPTHFVGRGFFVCPSTRGKLKQKPRP